MIPSTGVIIPSAGKGSRMASELPKQMLELGSMTILAHTITRILQVDSVRHLVIPASVDLAGKVAEIAEECIASAGKRGKVALRMASGGRERMHSVGNGLNKLAQTDAELVMVHDAVRPCFPLGAVNEALEVAHAEGAAILGVPARDTVKLVDDARQITSTPDRKRVWLAQTPQVFRLNLLQEAFQIAEKSGFTATDDASLAEFAGYPVRVVEGSHENIKVTYASDLIFVENWLKQNK